MMEEPLTRNGNAGSASSVIPAQGNECVREDALSARWKSVREPVAGSVIEGNCVAARRGGEQPEVNDQSVTQVNSIRPTVVASLLLTGEAQMTHWSSEGGNHEPVVR
jgi:hypothetical protein